MPNYHSVKAGLVVALLPSGIIYLLSDNITLTTIIALAIIYYCYKYVQYHKDRKEPLSILLNNEQLHFMLGNDNFLDIPLHKDQNITEVITSTIKHEMATIKHMVDKIYLVNIKDEQLELQLNNLIKN